MTLTSTDIKDQYNGTGAQTSFAVTFVFWDADDLQVTHRDAAGVDTIWVRGTQYTVTGGNASTGTIEVDTSPIDYTPASGETLTIVSNLENKQPTSLPVGGPLPSKTVEQQFDQNVRQIQQEVEAIARALTFPVADDSALSAKIPNSSDRASKFLAFDANGEPIASTGPTGDSSIPVSSYIETLLDDANSDAALATLVAAGTAIVNTFTKTQSLAKGADVASASPLVLGADGNYFDVTGTTGFSAITVAAGTLFMLQFDGALTMTDGASLDLGGSNITTATGDRALMFATAANTVVLIGYLEEGSALGLRVATPAEMESGGSNTVAVPPGRQHRHPSAAKIWAYVDRSAGTPSLSSPSYNVTSVTDDGDSQTIVTIATDFSTAIYAPFSAGIHASNAAFTTIHTLAVGSFKAKSWNATAAASDTQDFSCGATGDHS